MSSAINTIEIVEIRLDSANEIVIGDGCKVKLLIDNRHDATTGRVEEFLVVHSPTGERYIRNGYDSAQTAPYDRVWQAKSSCTKAVLFWGGVSIFRIDELGNVEELDRVMREVELSEYWDVEIVSKERFTIVVLESSIFRINEQLKVDWWATKYLDDRYVGGKRNTLSFISGSDERRELDLDSGTWA